MRNYDDIKNKLEKKLNEAIVYPNKANVFSNYGIVGGAIKVHQDSLVRPSKLHVLSTFQYYTNQILEEELDISEMIQEVNEFESRLITTYATGVPVIEIESFDKEEKFKYLKNNKLEQIQASQEFVKLFKNKDLNHLNSVNSILPPHKTRQIASWQSIEEMIKINDNLINYEKRKSLNISKEFIKLLDNIRYWLQKKISATKSTNNKINDLCISPNNYFLFIHPNIAAELRNDKDWENIQNYDYSKARVDFGGELIGIIWNIVVIESYDVPILYESNIQNIYRCFLMGQDAIQITRDQLNSNKYIEVDIELNSLGLLEVHLSINFGCQVIYENYHYSNKEFIENGLACIDIATH